MTVSKHASIRSKQRGIPPLIHDLLSEFGQCQYDGHGGLIRYFNRKSVRCMETRLGSQPVRCMSQWLDAYIVVSAFDGHTITIGRRDKRINRR